MSHPDVSLSPRRGRAVALMVNDFPVYSETFVAQLAADLVTAGCDLAILEMLGRQPRVEGWPELQARTRRLPAAPGLPGALGRIATLLRQVSLLARTPRYDIVHCQFATLGLLALRHLRLRSLRTRALVVHLRGYDITSFVQSQGARVYEPLFARADIFIANCAYFRDRAVSLGCPADRIVVIGSPIDTARFAPPARRRAAAGRPVRLIAVGRLVEKKGFADAIDAMAHLRDANREASLRILGSGPLRDDLQAQACRLGLGDRVFFAGRATPEEVATALRASDIALAPSVRAASGNEDASVNTAKEAMATGLPVIGTIHGGIPELVIPGENGDLVPERDPPALAAAIARMMDAPLQWAAMGAAGREKVVTTFDRAIILRQTLQAYERAIRRSGARE